ncbi:MAG: hypothetical protein ACRDSL_07175 [Pseudonocardiaceae bacterium]
MTPRPDPDELDLPGKVAAFAPVGGRGGGPACDLTAVPHRVQYVSSPIIPPQFGFGQFVIAGSGPPQSC